MIVLKMMIACRWWGSIIIDYVVDDEYAKDASDWEWGWRWWLWVYGGQLQETKHQKYFFSGEGERGEGEDECFVHSLISYTYYLYHECINASVVTIMFMFFYNFLDVQKITFLSTNIIFILITFLINPSLMGLVNTF